MISDRDFKFISRYEKISAENRAEFIEKHSNELVETFLTMLSTVSKDETIRYILCLINEIFLEDGSRVELFHSYCAKHKDSLWKHYFSLIFRDDEFIQNMVIWIFFFLKILYINQLTTQLIQSHSFHRQLF